MEVKNIPKVVQARARQIIKDIGTTIFTLKQVQSALRFGAGLTTVRLLPGIYEEDISVLEKIDARIADSNCYLPGLVSKPLQIRFPLLATAGCGICPDRVFTRYPLRLRGTRHAPRTVRTLGLNTARYQLISILISGFTCGLAGSFMSLSMEAWVPNVTAGRGWVALVIMYLGYKNPLGLFLASLFFGIAEILSNFSQGPLSHGLLGSLNLLPDLILASPYILSVLALLLYSVWDYHKKHPKKAKSH